RSCASWARSSCSSSKMERGTDTGSQTLIDATVAVAASSRLAYLVSYFANPGGGWQGALIKYGRGQPAQPRATPGGKLETVRPSPGVVLLLGGNQEASVCVQDQAQGVWDNLPNLWSSLLRPTFFHRLFAPP